MELLKSIVGQPVNHEADKKDPKKATVQAPEFDITQYAKKLGVVVGVLFPAVLGVLKAAKVEVSTSITIATLGVTAAALIGVSLAAAADILGRVYADRSSRWGSAAAGAGPSSNSLMTVWLREEEEGCPVLKVDRGESGTSYLVLRGSTSKKTVGDEEIEVYDEKPAWVDESKITAAAVSQSSTAAAKAVAGGSNGA
jgi:hypothetical protein